MPPTPPQGTPHRGPDPYPRDPTAPADPARTKHPLRSPSRHPQCRHPPHRTSPLGGTLGDPNREPQHPLRDRAAQDDHAPQDDNRNPSYDYADSRAPRRDAPHHKHHTRPLADDTTPTWQEPPSGADQHHPAPRGRHAEPLPSKAVQTAQTPPKPQPPLLLPPPRPLPCARRALPKDRKSRYDIRHSRALRPDQKPAYLGRVRFRGRLRDRCRAMRHPGGSPPLQRAGTHGQDPIELPGRRGHRNRVRSDPH